ERCGSCPDLWARARRAVVRCCGEGSVIKLCLRPTVSEVALSAALEDTGTPAMAVAAGGSSSPEMTAPEPDGAGGETVHLLHVAAEPKIEAAEQSATGDAAVNALCVPLPAPDPCGPDLDLAGDAEYLNFSAQVEGLLPSTFFSSSDGK